MDIDLLNGGAPLPVADAQAEQKAECQREVAQQAVVVAEKTEPSAPSVEAAPGCVREVVKPRRGTAPPWPYPRMTPTAWARRQMEIHLDRQPCPERRRLVDDRANGRDCMTEMSLYRSRPDVLANALLDMGVTESGDEAPDRR